MEAIVTEDPHGGEITITFTRERSSYIRAATARSSEATVTQFVQAAIIEYTRRTDAKLREAERRRKGGIVQPRPAYARNVMEWPR